MTVGYFYWVAAPTTLAICCNFLTGIVDVTASTTLSEPQNHKSKHRPRLRVVQKKKSAWKTLPCMLQIATAAFLFCCTQWKQLSTTRVRWRYTTALMFHRTRELLHALLYVQQTHTHMYQVPHMWDLLMCARVAWSHAWKENPDRTLVWTHVARQVERGGGH